MIKYMRFTKLYCEIKFMNILQLKNVDEYIRIFIRVSSFFFQYIIIYFEVFM